MADHGESWGPGSKFGILALVKWIAVEDLNIGDMIGFMY